MNKHALSWSDRIALMNHFKPSDDQACAAFGMTMGELNAARQMQSAGMFSTKVNIDLEKYPSFFDVATAIAATTADMLKAKPETATKRIKPPQKRGRKGTKIEEALRAVPTTRVLVEQFAEEHGISLAVLRQSKRFMSKLDPSQAKEIGTINVRKDKTTKALMIWREPPSSK